MRPLLALVVLMATSLSAGSVEGNKSRTRTTKAERPSGVKSSLLRRRPTAGTRARSTFRSELARRRQKLVTKRVKKFLKKDPDARLVYSYLRANPGTAIRLGESLFISGDGRTGRVFVSRTKRPVHDGFIPGFSSPEAFASHGLSFTAIRSAILRVASDMRAGKTPRLERMLIRVPHDDLAESPW